MGVDPSWDFATLAIEEGCDKEQMERFRVEPHWDTESDDLEKFEKSVSRTNEKNQCPERKFKR